MKNKSEHQPNKEISFVSLEGAYVIYQEEKRFWTYKIQGSNLRTTYQSLWRVSRFLIYNVGIISPCLNCIKKCLLKLTQLQLCKIHTVKNFLLKIPLYSDEDFFFTLFLKDVIKPFLSRYKATHELLNQKHILQN